MSEKVVYDDPTTYSNENPIHIGFFGINGVGKTTFAGKTGMQTVLLDCTDAGAVTLRDVKSGLKIVRIRSINHYLDVIDDINRRNDTEIVVVDTMSGLQSIALKEVKGRRNFEMNQRKWGLVSSRIIECITETHNFPSDVIYLAQEKRSGNDDEPTTFGPALTPSSAGFLSNNIDYIGRIYLENNSEGKVDRMVDFRITEYLNVKDRANTFPKLLKNPSYVGIRKRIINQLRGEESGKTS